MSMQNPWSHKETAPKTGEWIIVCKSIGEPPFTVQYITPFSADPSLADWRDDRGKVREWSFWKAIR